MKNNFLAAVESKYPFIDSVFKGIGQIMLQENVLTGFLFLVGVFIGSFQMGLAVLFATVCATTAAHLMKYEKTAVQKGLYGFNAALVGVALVLFFDSSLVLWISIAVGAVSTTLLQQFFMHKKITVFTLPFVLVTWLFLYLFLSVFPQPTPPLPEVFSASGSVFYIPFKGYGQIIFQEKTLPGVLFFIGVLMHARLASLHGLIAGGFAALISWMSSAPSMMIEDGLFSYNAILCALVFSGNSLKDILWMFISVVLSVLISLGMYRFGFTQLTFPFVAASVITLVIKKQLAPLK